MFPGAIEPLEPTLRALLQQSVSGSLPYDPTEPLEPTLRALSQHRYKRQLPDAKKEVAAPAD